MRHAKPADIDGVEFEIADSVLAAIEAGTPPVQAFREWRGYDVVALAAASGVSAGYIAEHEAGQRALTQQECEAIGEALGVPCELLQD